MHIRNQQLSVKYLLIILTLLASLNFFAVRASTSANIGDPAPNFTLTDIQGHRRMLSEFAKKPTVLFFFCGCRWCHDAARAWSVAQRSGATASRVHTVIVYSGGPEEAKSFLTQTGLAGSAALLLDKYMDVSLDLYQAEPCPRVFVLTSDQKIFYTNSHTYDAARTISGAALIANVQAALNSVEQLTSGSMPSGSSSNNGSSLSVFLTPIACDGTVVTGQGNSLEAAYHFGTVKQSVGSVTHVFKLQNNTATSINVTSLQPSCGCTNAFIGNNDEFPVPVKPGAIINITVYVDLSDLYPAAVQKSVMVFTSSQISPLAFLEVDGNLTLP